MLWNQRQPSYKTTNALPLAYLGEHRLTRAPLHSRTQKSLVVPGAAAAGLCQQDFQGVIIRLFNETAVNRKSTDNKPGRNDPKLEWVHSFVYDTYSFKVYRVSAVCMQKLMKINAQVEQWWCKKINDNNMIPTAPTHTNKKRSTIHQASLSPTDEEITWTVTNLIQVDQ